MNNTIQDNQTKQNNIDNVEYNYGLLLKEMEKRNVGIEFVGNTGMVLADYFGHKELIFDLTFSQTSYTSAWIASDKFYSKKFLESINVPTPQGEVFDIEDKRSIKQYVSKLKYPIVIKPLTSSHGVNVYSNIESAEELDRALVCISQESPEERDILIEKYVSGSEYRLFVTQKGFFAAVNRVPASVVGDGSHTILELVEAENFKRMNPRIKLYPIL